ncbi:retention module-containing protein [Halomonas sp. DP4Y7-1]|nr:retention module-containing protein [Halomonas sp. DP4Y7-1]
MEDAVIVAIVGEAWIRDASGNTRHARIGDRLDGDCVLITGAASSATVDTGNGSLPLVLEASQQLSLPTSQGDAENDVFGEPLDEEQLDKLLNALDSSNDSNNDLAPQAGSVGAGGGGNEGHGFVRLLRIVEQVSPLEYAFNGLVGDDISPRAGGANTHDGDTENRRDETPPRSLGLNVVLDEDGLPGGIAGGPEDVPGIAVFVTGTLGYRFGADGPNASQAFTWTTAGLPSVTSGGEAVTWSVSEDGLTLSGTDASGNAVLTVEVTNVVTGAYEATLRQGLDHSDPAVEDDIDLVLKFTITDGDGDSVSGSLKLTVDDDIPVVSITGPDEADPDGGLSGGWTTSGGGDGQGEVVITVPGDTTEYAPGTPIDTGTGTLTVNPDNTWTYTPDSGDGGGELPGFVISVTDGDGDVVTGSYTPPGVDTVPTTPDSDGDPATLAPVSTLDEDGLPGGIAGGIEDVAGEAVTATGTLGYDFGDDGAASSGAFSWNTSGLPSVTSGGEAVTWSVSDDGLTLSGTDASGDTVLTAVVTDVATGAYEATLHQGLDHSDDSKEDDINLSLGYTVTDSDGSTADGSLALVIDDDMPVVSITGPDEADPDGGLSGSWTTSGGGDGQGEVVITVPGDTTEYAPGTPIDTGTGTLTVNPDNTWTYTPDSGDGGGELPGFVISVTDGDGDVVTGSYTPPSPDTVPTTPDSDGDPATLAPVSTLDEDGLPGGIAGGIEDVAGEAVTATGSLGYDFGDDGAASSGAFSWNTSGLPSVTSGGEAVTWSVSDDGLTLSGTDASGDTVLTAVVTDVATGAYEATLHQGLDHSDDSKEDDITLSLGYTVTDSDGSTADGSLALLIDDDMPVVSITGPDEADPDGGLSGGWTTSGGGDGQGEVVITVPGDTTEYAPGDDITTDGGVLVVNPDNTWTYTPDSGDEGGELPGFVISVTDGDGDVVTGSYTPPGVDTVPTTPDADGDPATLSPVSTLDEDGLPGGIAGGIEDVAGEAVTATGTLGYDFGDDGAASSGAFSWNTSGLPSVTSGGEAVTWSVSDDGLTLSGTDASGDTVLTAVVTDVATGAYEATLHQGLDHSDDSKEDDINLSLGYTVTDSDGSTADGSLALVIDDDMPVVSITGPDEADPDGGLSGGWTTSGGGDGQGEVVVTVPGDTTEYAPGTPIDTGTGTLTVNPDNTWTYTPDSGDGGGELPGFVISVTDGDGDVVTGSYTPPWDTVPTTPDSDGDPATLAPVSTLDEDGLPGGIAGGIEDVAGEAVTATGSLGYDFGDDGAASSGAFSWNTSGLPSVTSGGEAVTWSVSDDGLTLSGTDASGDTVLTAVVTDVATGAYEATLHQGLDHSDDSKEDDITLSLGYTVTDSDGSTADGSLALVIDDDMPVVSITGPDEADPDGGLSGGWTTSGGGDGQGEVVITVPGDTTEYAPGDDITTDGGVLVVNPDNTWTYTPDSGDEGGELPGFVISVTDGDGDVVTGSYTPPAPDTVPTTPDADGDPATLAPVSTLDEDGLPGGIAGGIEDVAGEAVTATGSLGYDFGDDGAASSGAFSWNTSGLPSVTSGGEAVTWSVSDDGLTLSGTDASGDTVLTAVVTDVATGAYEATLHQGLDHSDDSKEDDITLSLGYTVTDSDGSTADGSLALVIDDDMPVVSITGPDEADPDGGLSGGWTTSGGGDGQGEVVITVPGDTTEYAPGTPIDTGTGTLTVNPDNTWTYTPDSGDVGGELPGFVISVTDGDGDVVTGSYTPPGVDTVPTTPDADGDPATLSPVSTLDEDGLPGGIAGGIEDVAGEAVTATGSLGYDFGDDGAASSGAFSWNTSGLPSVTSGGEAVTWSVSDDGLTLSGTDASGDTVLTAVVTDVATGAYEATLHQGLDHSDDSKEDDINLSLGYTVTDSDGSTAEGSLTLAVDDDSPTITMSVDGGAKSVVEGTVTTGKWSYDPGADGSAKEIVGRVPTENGFRVFALGEEVVTETGTLVVDADGTWTFTALPGLDQTTKPTLEFTLERPDADGDVAANTLMVDIIDGSVPVTPDSDGDPDTGSAAVTVDEMKLSGGSDSATTNLAFDYGPDGAAENEAFKWDLSTLDSITSRDKPVVFTVSDDGMSVFGEADGTRVLTITLTDDSQGDVSVMLSDPIDHPTDGGNNLTLTVGYTITDKDGSQANGVLDVTVLDDGPSIGVIDLGRSAVRPQALLLEDEEPLLPVELAAELEDEPSYSALVAIDEEGVALDIGELLDDLDHLEGGEQVLAVPNGGDTVLHVKLDGGLSQDGSNADLQVTLPGVAMEGDSDAFLARLLESSQTGIE